MEIATSTVVVTGANRGLGRAFVTELVRRGAKVYAAARRPELVDIPGVTVLALDVTNAASATAAAEKAVDADILINNAATSAGGNLVTGDLASIRDVMNTNYYGTLNMVRAFAPVLGRNGGGAILNVLSGAAWETVPGNTAYAAAKSAQWGLTNGIRIELADQGTLVSALVPGLIATETLLAFAAEHDYPLPKEDLNEPEHLASLALDRLAAGDIEILDQSTIRMKRALSR
ncbi:MULTISPECIES: SDR family NAD(P)-dependent oxidoreductase [Micromonospora]|uniref:Short-chain dehydrogenase n=1 Tax=Micromonospora haikouensis TaxID=686309 RepID=A0A0D0V6E3_9ACTN|nr:SDR family NAD(P)-dependent oxidoreductase [Micromonospora haikouensis]KIR66467.1 short-chain dehydrogenase [Micromonospora haikouensis]